ncbi:MAG TPA: CoB--CoM heterodisulfide reductase iron-sulfur subunit A family protein, partial [Thermodesulfovibrionales bacterium]|nr:CoB--CoM heterodisulfide reductase iron-sulfur subunit A family protein [Thermodesulfovibrionales bacterium]
THNLFCSEDGKSFLADDIVKEGPDRVVIAACTPKEHEKTFRDVLKKSGINPYLFQMVNIREQVAWATSDSRAATEKAKSYIRAAVKRVALNEPLEKREIDVNTNVIVIGAGPAGMESALLLAKAGRKVYLVEKNSFIGGRPARYEDVFPKMECASCMLEPAMDEILHDEHIEVHTCSEVQEVLGFIGNFTARIIKKATRVDRDKCIGCGACYDACPIKTKNEFDYKLSDRKAIYVPYTGALPNVPVIDEKHCIRFKGESDICREALDLGLITKEEYERHKTEECSLCKEACMFDAINYDDKEETVVREAGGIIVATGFDLFDPSALLPFGYGSTPEVYTSLEFERILSQTGPTGGKLVMKDAREPESIAIIHCVGSRDKDHHEYCSGICCLYALKYSRLIRKHLPSTDIYHIYADWCVPGKDNQPFLDSVRADDNIHFIHTGLPMRADIIQDDKRLNVLCTDVSGKKREILSDMVVLCPAIIPSGDSARIAGLLGIAQGRDGFFAEGHTKLAPVSTNIEGICIAGCAQGPKDIQGSVAQGAAAAGKILSILMPGRKLELEAASAEVDGDACSGCMTCIGLCPYKAITFDKEKKVSVINAALCKGCGTCVAACPSRSIKGRHFTTEQIFAEIREVLK